MEDLQNHLTLATSMVGVMFGLLCCILGWIGNRISVKLESLDDKVDKLASELHTRVNQLDQRVVRLETRCDFEHGKPK